MPDSRPLGGQRRARSSLAGRMARIGLALLVIGAPLLLGGVYPWGMAITAAVALATLALTWAGDPAGKLPLTPLSLAVIAAFGWTVVQALPLPCAVTQWVASASVEQLQIVHRLLDLPPPQWCTISRDPAATREEIVKGMAIVAGFLSALMLSRAGHRRWVLGSVVACGVVFALVAFAHKLAAAESVFGLYRPVEARHLPLLTPLINPNTAGGLMAMCMPPLIGLTLAARSTPVRLALGSGAALVASGVLMTRSRGAVGALVAGLLLLALFAAIKRRRSDARPTLGLRRRLESIGIPVVLVVGLGLSIYAWYAEVLAEFEASSWDKLYFIFQAARFSLLQPWLGVGRGAFGSTFAVFFNTRNRFEHAENFVVQWLSEWGYPLSLLLLAVMAVAFWRALRSARSLDRLGALAGLAAFTAQSLVDLGLELVGVAVVAAVLLAAATTERAERRVRDRTVRSSWLGPLVPLGFAAVLALLWKPMQVEHRHYIERGLRASFERGDRASFRRTLERALLAHPTEPMFPLLGAADALRYREPSAGRWINRALQLVPSWPAPHLQAAQWLLQSGRRSQALLELGVAAGLDPWDSRDLLCPMATVDLKAVAALKPKGLERGLFFRVLAACFQPETALAAQLDAIILQERPNDPWAWLREGRRSLAAGDARTALEAAGRARAVPPNGQPALELRAQALAALGRRLEALAALRQAERTARDPQPLLEQQARVLADMGDRRGLEQTLSRLRGLAGESTAAVAQVFMLEADLEQQLGNLPGAMAAYEEAYGITGETRALHGIAKLADEQGDRRRAALAYAQLCELTPTDVEACARRAQLLGSGKVAELPGTAAQPKPE